MHRFRALPKLRCRGSAHPVAMIFGVSLIVAGVLVGMLSLLTGSASTSGVPGKKPLIVMVGASLKPAFDAVAKAYREQYGIEIQAQYDASDNLLNAIKIARTGDLFLPAEELYLQRAREQGLAREIIPVAHTRPVIAVRRGNPKKITGLRDLLRPDVRVGVASPAAAIGRLSQEAFVKSGNGDAFAARRSNSDSKFSDLGKEPEVANSIKLDAVDAGIIWDASVTRYPELEGVSDPVFDALDQQVSIGVLECSTDATRALHFARFLSARDRGLPQFKTAGYRVVDGDEWAENPQLTVFLGAMLRPAMTETLKDFAAREGLPPINTTYNGCGILVGQMKTGARPDMYFACDTSFMSQVQDLFQKADVISANEMVIVVKKGNPLSIKELKDLTQPGLKLGVGEERQCALGWLTKDVLDRSALCEKVEKNIAVRSTTGDMLIAQMPALDAAIVYRSNAMLIKDRYDVVPVDLPQHFAQQPVAVAKESKYRQLTERLLEAIRSSESQARFRENGFQWIPKPK